MLHVIKHICVYISFPTAGFLAQVFEHTYSFGLAHLMSDDMAIQMEDDSECDLLRLWLAIPDPPPLKHYEQTLRPTDLAEKFPTRHYEQDLGVRGLPSEAIPPSGIFLSTG